MTSKEVTKKIIDKYGGRLISLEHSSPPERNIDFTWKVNNYSLDPNRMFSKVGIQKSLDVKDKEIAEMVYSFAMKVAEIITVPITNNIVIAVHNNYNKGYSVDSYRGLTMIQLMV